MKRMQINSVAAKKRRALERKEEKAKLKLYGATLARGFLSRGIPLPGTSNGSDAAASPEAQANAEHAMNTLPEVYRPNRVVDSPSGILDDLFEVRRRAFVLAELVKPEYAAKVLELITTVTKTEVEMAAKLKVMVGGLSREQWERIKGKIVVALADFPDARLAVLEAIKDD